MSPARWHAKGDGGCIDHWLRVRVCFVRGGGEVHTAHARVPEASCVGCVRSWANPESDISQTEIGPQLKSENLWYEVSSVCGVGATQCFVASTDITSIERKIPLVKRMSDVIICGCVHSNVWLQHVGNSTATLVLQQNAVMFALSRVLGSVFVCMILLLCYE